MADRSAYYLDLVTGRRRGPLATFLRLLLAMAAVPYRGVIALRNVWYNVIPFATRRVDVPVISIGNITVGGTGKTPMVISLAEELLTRGLRVAVLARGYMGDAIAFDDQHRDQAVAAWSRANDEALVLRQRCPRAEVYLNPDRVAAARRAVEAGADCLLLDDGFQHRRLGRDLDLVLIDATRPFGSGQMLPRGLLREPLASLKRAGLIVLTRSDEVAPTEANALLHRLGQLSGGRPVVRARQRVVGLCDVKGRDVEHIEPSSMLAIAFAGIGNFPSFRRTVESLGVCVRAAFEFPDHHHYTDEDIAGLVDAAARHEANILLTTEKDAVKLVGRWPEGSCPLRALRIAVEFLGDDVKMVHAALDQALDRARRA
jgi:tetraacyldisaccharide 4'-kinase